MSTILSSYYFPTSISGASDFSNAYAATQMETRRALGEEPSLHGRVTEIGHGPLVYVFGGMWILLLVDGLFKLIKALWEYIDNPAGNGLKKKCITTGAVLGGVIANSMHWGDSVEMFNLGIGAPIARSIGFSSSAFVSVFGIVDACERLFCTEAETPEAVSSQKLLALFDLGYRVTTLAWSILGILGLIAEELLLPITSGIIFATSFLFFLAGMIYRAYLDRQLKEIPPAAQST